jgi:hypothetical protein
MLELLLLGVLHDGVGLRILLEHEALLVPADRLGLLDQRGADPGERAYLGRELFGRLVVLVEGHRVSMSPRDSARPKPLASFG